MKKALLAMVIILAFASSSFAGVSFLTAPSVGEGNWAVLGMYATDHNGVVANADSMSTTAFDSNSIGVRGEYGLQKDLDLLVAYSFDTLPNIKIIDEDPILGGAASGKQTSGTTMGLGVKYSLGEQTLPLIGKVVDTAVAVGYEQSNAGVKSDAVKLNITKTTMSIGYIVSKQMDNLMPYGAVAYKMLTQDYGKSSWDALSGTALAFNIGCMIGIAKDQAIAVEYNTETDAFGGAVKPYKAMTGKANDATATSVSGISLGYVYLF